MATEKVGLYHEPRNKRKPWAVRWFGENTDQGRPRRYSQSFKLKREAEDFQAAKQAELNSGGKRDRVTLTLKELCEKFLHNNRHRFKRGTIDRYELTISQMEKHFGSGYSIRKMDRESAESFIAGLKIIHPAHKRKNKQISAGHRNRYLSCAKSIFKIAVDYGYLTQNPFVGIKNTKRTPKAWHFIKPDDFKAVMAVTPQLRLRAVYSVMYGCGLRYGEAINLLWNGKDIDFERGRINITNRPATGKIPPFLVKDYEHRSLLMPQWLQDMLIELQAEAGEGNPFVFITSERWGRVREAWGRMFKQNRSGDWENCLVCNNVLRTFRAACIRAGIKTDKSLALHNLRKSFAQNLADNGTPISTLQKLMGHSDIQTTAEFYLQTSDANEQRACEVLDSIMMDEVKPTDVKLTYEPIQGESQKNRKPVSRFPVSTSEHRGDKI